MTFAGQHRPERVDEGALASPGDAADPNAISAASVGQQRLQNFLSELRMIRLLALDQRDGSSEDGTIAATYAVDIRLRIE